jgi:TonB-dependent receptor
MQSRSFKLLQAAMLTGAANIAIVGSAQAQDQALSSALRDYALKTGKNLVYPPSMVANKRANAVSGRHTPKQALRLLLRGTSISFRELQGNVLALTVIGNSRIRQNAANPATVSPAVVQSASATSAMQADPGIDDGPTGVVSGTVVNRSTGAALKGALVRIDGTNLETVTDDRGQYYFPAVPRGQQTVRVEYLGEAARTAIVSVAPGSRQEANIQLGAANQDIVVFGYRSSIQQALNKQKNADNNATIVSADLLGGFPAETVSEALRRVPGVAFGRDDETGEGSRITVRGFSSEAINVQLNGLEVQGTGFERTVDLSGFLTDNISEITIHKSLLPSHEATGSGGLVEIETKSGLDYGDFSANFSIEGETNFDRAFGEEYQINGTVAGKLTDNFGIAASLQYRRSDRLNYTAFFVNRIPPVFPVGSTSLFNVPASNEFPFDPELDSQLLISSGRYTRSELLDEAIVGSVNLAWDIASHTRLRLDFQRNQNDSRRSNSGSTIGFGAFLTDMPIPELDNEVRRRVTLSSFRPSIVVSETDERIASDSISFRGDTDIGRWEFEYKAGYARSKRSGDNTSLVLQAVQPDILGAIDPNTVVINPDDDAAMTPRVVNGAFIESGNGLIVPSLTQAGLDFINDPASYDVFSAITNPIDNPTETYSGEFQARYNTPLDFLTYVELGGKYQRNKRTTNGNVTNARTVASERYLRIAARPISLSAFDGGVFDQDGFGQLGARGFSIPFLSTANGLAVFNQLDNFIADDPSTPDFNEERLAFTDFTQADPIEGGAGFLVPTRTIEEKFSGYLESKLTLGDFDLIAGVRYEREKRSGVTLSSQSFRLNEPGFRTEPRETFVEQGLVSFESTSGTVETWTPSFLLTYRPIENITARLGYFRSTVNPDFRLLNRGTTFSVDLRPGFGRVTILEANPSLKPSTTDNYDFDIAYYFDDSPGLVRAGFFYKKISNNFTNVSFTPVDNTDVLQRFRDRYEPLAATRPDLLALPEDAELLVNRPENGEGGTIWGIEGELIRRLTFLPGFLSDFGVLANVTYTNGDFPTLVSARDDDGNTIQLSLDRPLRDQARWVYNLSLDYERDGFQGRVIYTSQSASVETFDEFNINTVIPGYDTLDARFSYSFEKAGGLWTLFLEGDDLLRGAKKPDIRETTSSRFGDGEASFDFPNTFQFNGGRTITFGVRAKF